MKEQNLTPFEEEKPQIVHFEKDDSHYEYCRMQMHEIEHVHRRTFICNMVLCIFVCFLAMFQVYVGGFGVLSAPFAEIDAPGAILAGGIFQIIISMGIIIVGYLAWANFHSLNIVLEAWYIAVTLLGICKFDYVTALVGIVGVVFYFFSFREMRREQALSEMEGYPDFPEKLDISKSDIVIQTLLAHKGEKRQKSTLFTTDYSLRRMKKKKTDVFGETDDKEEGAAGVALAAALKKSLDEAKTAEEKPAPAEETAPAEEASEPEEMEDLTAETEPAEEKAMTPEEDARAQAAAILAEAQEKAKAILEKAEEKKEPVRTTDTQAVKQPQNRTGNPGGNKKKKKRH